MLFTDFNFNDELLDALDAMRFKECTPIQEASIPTLLQGKDLIGVAQTGTGKTAAYLLPIINRLCSEDFDSDVINCIIMAPTRELAQQIDQQLEAFSYFLPISGLAVYGGNDAGRYEQERKSMQLGADILIATPGRLITHLSLGNVELSHVSMFVLDEADRMMDMGFIDDIKKIISYLPSNRQTILFSATMPAEIKELAKDILTEPTSIELAVSKPAEKILQYAYICHENQKIGLIRDIFKDDSIKRSIIFAASKKKVHEITNTLKQKKLNVMEMHSDLEQQQRDEVLRAFKANRVDLIVSTDLLSRGIDIDDISVVINFDVPQNVENYVHRIGRTARANHSGKAITFVNEKDQIKFRSIDNYLKNEIQIVPVPEELGEAPQYSRQTSSGHKKFRHSPNSKPTNNNNGNQGKKFKRHRHKPSGRTDKDRQPNTNKN